MIATLPRKLARRGRYWLSRNGGAFRERRLVWCSIAAYEKLGASQCKQCVVREF